MDWFKEIFGVNNDDILIDNNTRTVSLKNDPPEPVPGPEPVLPSRQAPQERIPMEEPIERQAFEAQLLRERSAAAAGIPQPSQPTEPASVVETLDVSDRSPENIKPKTVTASMLPSPEEAESLLNKGFIDVPTYKSLIARQAQITAEQPAGQEPNQEPIQQTINLQTERDDPAESDDTNISLSPKTKAWSSVIGKYTKDAQDAALVTGIMDVESGGEADARSPVGAQGLMQIMPATGKELAEKAGEKYDPQDAEQNIRLGVNYLNELKDRYNGNITDVLAAYNSGMGTVDKAKAKAAAELGIDIAQVKFNDYSRYLPNETQLYVSKVIARTESNPQLIQAAANAAISESKEVGFTAGAQQAKQMAQDTGALKAVEDKAYQEKVVEIEQVEQEKQLTAYEEYRQRLEKIDAASAELAKTPYKSFWSSKSTGEKILAAIAVGLGAYASAMNNQPNFALNIIQGAIDRDLAIQKAERAEQKGNIKEQKSTLDIAYKLYNDESIAEAAVVAEAWKKVQEEEVHAGRVMENDNARREQAGNFSNGVNTKNIESNLKLAKMVEEKEQIDARAIAKNATSSGTYENQQAYAGTIKNRSKDEKGTAISVGGDKGNGNVTVGYFGDANTPGEGQKFRESYSGYESSIKGIDELSKNIKESSWWRRRVIPASTEKVKAESIQTALIGNLRIALTGPGTMSETDRELLESAINTGTALFSFDANSLSRLDELKKALGRIMAANADALGLTVVPLKKFSPRR